MRLTQISIENFKGIRDRVEIPLRPITLLFGANSAGKSTILQALLYLRELLEHQNADADFLSASGAAIHLGGFRQMVHRHEISRDVCVGVTMALDDDGLPIYGAEPIPGTTEVEAAKPIGADLATIGVEVSVSWNPETQSPFIKTYRVMGDGEEMGAILHQQFGKQRLNLSEYHPVYAGILEVESRYSMETEVAGPLGFMNGSDLIVEQAGVIPDWYHPLTAEFIEHGESVLLDIAQLQELLRPIIVGVGEFVRAQLCGIRYIGPVRQFPERAAIARRTPSQDRWASGLAAWDWLGQEIDEAKHTVDLENFDRLLKDKAGLNLGYSVQVTGFRQIQENSELHQLFLALRHAREPEEKLPLLLELLELEYSMQPVERRVVITDERNGAEVAPQDVGNGVTQVIPVIAGVIAPGGNTLAIEQPELHLHPAIQCRLADVFIRALHSGQERLFLLESHSEHLMLRLMRRIRETSEGVHENENLALRPKDLSVVYVEAIPEGVKMTLLPLTEDGDFSRNWPAGFFEDRAAELF